MQLKRRIRPLTEREVGKAEERLEQESMRRWATCSRKHGLTQIDRRESQTSLSEKSSKNSVVSLLCCLFSCFQKTTVQNFCSQFRFLFPSACWSPVFTFSFLLFSVSSSFLENVSKTESQRESCCFSLHVRSSSN